MNSGGNSAAILKYCKKLEKTFIFRKKTTEMEKLFSGVYISTTWVYITATGVYITPGGVYITRPGVYITHQGVYITPPIGVYYTPNSVYYIPRGYSTMMFQISRMSYGKERSIVSCSTTGGTRMSSLS